MSFVSYPTLSFLSHLLSNAGQNAIACAMAVPGKLVCKPQLKVSSSQIVNQDRDIGLKEYSIARAFGLCVQMETKGPHLVTTGLWLSSPERSLWNHYNTTNIYYTYVLAILLKELP